MIHRLSRPIVRQIRSVRALGMGPSTSDGILSDALSAIGSILPSMAQKASPSIPPKIPPPSDVPTIMNIPPAEDPLLQYLTSTLQKHGHKAKAARITSRTMLHLHAFTRSPPMPILREAILMASPAVRSMIHRRGAKNVVKPVALGEKQRTRFALQWILAASDKKSGQTVEERLAREFIAVLQGTSDALRKKEEVHRFAMVNRGNAQWRI